MDLILDRWPWASAPWLFTCFRMVSRGWGPSSLLTAGRVSQSSPAWIPVTYTKYQVLRCLSVTQHWVPGGMSGTLGVSRVHCLMEKPSQWAPGSVRDPVSKDKVGIGPLTLTLVCKPVSIYRCMPHPHPHTENESQKGGCYTGRQLPFKWAPCFGGVACSNTVARLCRLYSSVWRLQGFNSCAGMPKCLFDSM